MEVRLQYFAQGMKTLFQYRSTKGWDHVAIATDREHLVIELHPRLDPQLHPQAPPLSQKFLQEARNQARSNLPDGRLYGWPAGGDLLPR